MPLIEVRDLVKEYKINVRNRGLTGAIQSLLVPEYKIKQAVQSISFSIEKGEMVGFIGPNGAGKSTTVKMLTGVLVPTSGTVSIGGLSAWKDRRKNASRIGVVFGQRSQLWWDLPVSDSFEMLRHIYRIPDKIYKENIERFNELLGINEFINQPVRQLSLGQKMRADIAAALLHDPDVIFFDEPTIGLDVVAKERIREFIRYINKEKGTSMLFTTHDMDDIEQTCSRMIIIDHGRKVYDGLIEDIKETYGKSRMISVEFAKAYDNVYVSGAELIEKSGNKMVFRYSKDEVNVSRVINELTSAYEIVDFTVTERGIESIIRDIYQKEIELSESLS